MEHAEVSCRLTGFKQTGMISTLAAAYAEAGRYPEAVTTAELAKSRCKPPMAKPSLRP